MVQFLVAATQLKRFLSSRNKLVVVSICALLSLEIVAYADNCSRDTCWNSENSWFHLKGADEVPVDDWCDVFYLVSTNILSERNESGDTLYLASLTPKEKAVLSKEIGYVATHVFCDSMNFFSPFYHQHTMEAINLTAELYGALKKKLVNEVYEAFCYYFENLNGGRPFIVAGFSQGAMLVKEILKLMTSEQYSHMAAAYLLGWGLNDDDLKYSFIKPAQSSDDYGVTISYNTVASPDGIWNAVMDNGTYCINPVNWKSDSSPAYFEYKGQQLQACVDTSAKVLVVNGFKEEILPFVAPWPEGCLHHYEFIFFAKELGANAKLRAYHHR